ncbi:MAG: DJ-1/PfpI family protein [Gallintestinimicrobium sp.]
MAKIGVFFSAGYEEIEALTVVDLCRRAGIEVTMVSVDETAAVTGSHQITCRWISCFLETDFDAFDLLVLPGECLNSSEDCDGLMEQLDRFYSAGKWVAAICAAPQIFGHRGYLKGERRRASLPWKGAGRRLCDARRSRGGWQCDHRTRHGLCDRFCTENYRLPDFGRRGGSAGGENRIRKVDRIYR